MRARRRRASSASASGSLVWPACSESADAVHVAEGPFRQSAPIWAGTVAPDGPYEIRDATATDTVELLLAAGYSQADVDAMTEAGIVA